MVNLRFFHCFRNFNHWFYFQVVYCHVNKTACIIGYNTLYHCLRPWDPGHMKDTDVNWRGKVKDWGIPLQHRLSIQRWADGINMWPHAAPTFKHLLRIQIWIIRNIKKNVFKKLEIEIMICGYTTSYKTEYQNWCHPTQPF